MKKVLSIFLLIICCLSIMACSEETDSVDNIKATDVWAYHDTTITITSSYSTMGEEPARFKDSIKESHITLEEGLVGKSVKSVKYISESEIEVLLTGKVKDLTNGDYGIITISKKALFNDCDAFTIVNINKSSIRATGVKRDFINGLYNYTFFLELDNGSFTEHANMENVKLVEGVGGVLKNVELVDGKLKIMVEGVTNYPTVLLGASTNTFNKAVNYYLGGSSIEME